MATPKPKQELTPLLPEEVERLRAEWCALPVHDSRRRLLALLDKERMEADVVRRLLVDQGREIRELRAAVDKR